MKAKPHTSRTRRSASGFSLLEILLAVTIFSIVTSAIYTTFRSATRAYDIGITSGKILQTGRVSVDVVSKDIKSCIYKTETTYNIMYNQRLNAIRDEYNNSQQKVFDRKRFEEMIDTFNTENIAIDLGFRGGGSDISFVRRQIDTPSARRLQPNHLARVHYFIQERELMREETNIFKNPIDYLTEEVVPQQPHPETIVQDVDEFVLKYGYYYDGEWREADDWDSSSHNHRVDQMAIPPNDLMLERLQGNIQQVIGRAPEDGLPGYVRIKISMADPKKKGHKNTFEKIVNLANAAETHVPLPEEFSINDDEGKAHTYHRSDFLQDSNGKQRGDRYHLRSVEERRRTHGGA